LPSRSGYAGGLFSSKVRVEILGALFLDPEKPLYIREIERKTGQDFKGISRELTNLYDIGLLKVHREGNLKYYRLNKKFLIYQELRDIFLKTSGAVAVIGDALAGVAGIDFAFVYGSYATGLEREMSDIDLMVICAIPLEDLLKILRGPEERLARDVNHSLYDTEEVRKRCRENDPFIAGVMAGQKIMLIGDEDGLRRAVE
jgi:DNA-binding transcriptional ArsR family regulator